MKEIYVSGKAWLCGGLILSSWVFFCGANGPTSRPISMADESHEMPPTSAFLVQSKAFNDGQPIPKRYTTEGEDISPPLSWTNPPAGTAEFALICDDPNAPTPQPWVHWVIYKIPADCIALPEGIERQAEVEVLPGVIQGRNSWPKDNLGYRGPAPPKGSGVHHYHFRLYALNQALDVVPVMDKKALLKAMKGHIIGQAELIGTYER